MPETEEEKKARWAKNRATSFMTPQMTHAMQMSKFQSQNKYKEHFNKTKAKGYTSVASTPELEHVKTQSIRVSQNKYKSDFEKNKSKFTSVSDDPESLRVKRVTNQNSKIAYSGKGLAVAESRYKPPKTETKKEPAPVTKDPEPVADDAPPSYGRPVEDDDETIQEQEEQEQLDTKENGDSREPDEVQYSNTQDVDYGQDNVDNHQDYEQTPEENNDHYPEEDTNHYEEKEEIVQHQNDERETKEMPAGGREYDEEKEQETDERETKEMPAGGREYDEEKEEENGPELVEYGEEGGLDNFYANLG